MKQVLDFLRLYYRELIVLVFQFVTLLILIFKKKVKVQDIMKQVLMVLPDFINIAEDKFNTGSEKYAYVFNRCVELLRSLTGKKSEEVLSTYTADIDAAIERILSTPQKKER